MQDMIINQTGNSRYLKSAITSSTTWEEFRAALIAGTLPIDFNGINAEGIQQAGTPLNKANLLDSTTETALDASTVNAALYKTRIESAVRTAYNVDNTKPIDAILEILANAVCGSVSGSSMTFFDVQRNDLTDYVGNCKIKTGSYTGTGTGGKASVATTIATGLETPKFLFVSGLAQAGVITVGLFDCAGLTSSFVAGKYLYMFSNSTTMSTQAGSVAYAKIADGSVSFYGAGAQQQFNTSSITYNWFAIGA